MQIVEMLLRQWLTGFLQARIVDTSKGDSGRKETTTAEQRRESKKHNLKPLIDASVDPRKWHIRGDLAAQLEPMVNRIHDEERAGTDNSPLLHIDVMCADQARLLVTTTREQG